ILAGRLLLNCCLRVLTIPSILRWTELHILTTAREMELRAFGQDDIIPVVLCPLNDLLYPVTIGHCGKRHIDILIPPGGVDREAPDIGVQCLTVPGDPLCADPGLKSTTNRIAKLQLRP